MGRAQSAAPVKLLAGLLASADDLLEQAVRELCQVFGALDASSAVTDWNLSTYYQAEMGSSIRRQFVTFEKLFDPEELPAFKCQTNDMEDTWRTEKGRQVNIDPGYIATGKLVLASTKDAAHRIYLRGGIYAEVTLHFCNGSFQAYSHSYPDYAATDAIAFFNRARAVYLSQLRVMARRAEE